MEDKYKYSGINDCFGNEIKAGDTIRAGDDVFAGRVYYSFSQAAFKVKVIKIGTGMELRGAYTLPKFIKQREKAIGSKVRIAEKCLTNVFNKIYGLESE